LSQRPEPSGCAVHEEVDGLEDNMVDGLFFCSTLTDRSGGHTPFAQAGVETPVRRRLIRTQALLGRATPGGLGAGVGDENAESCGVVRPHRIPLVIRPLRRT